MPTKTVYPEQLCVITSTTVETIRMKLDVVSIGSQYLNQFASSQKYHLFFIFCRLQRVMY